MKQNWHNFTRTLRGDLDAAKDRDPAAGSAWEVALTYPGLHAVWGYRVAHALWNRGARVPARLVQNGVRFWTGVDIHPAAELGRRLFIDHAEGVVIGETAVVGEDVLIFHQVTLGGVSMDPGKRRHPTVGDRVILGAGAKVLGPIEIGSDARVGANAVVLKDVPDHAVAVGVPAKLARSKTEVKAGCTHEKLTPTQVEERAVEA